MKFNVKYYEDRTVVQSEEGHSAICNSKLLDGDRNSQVCYLIGRILLDGMNSEIEYESLEDKTYREWMEEVIQSQ